MGRLEPMRLAILADIHGNAPALRAVLDDMARFAPDAVADLGDVVSGPLWPAETMALLRGFEAVRVRGNHDRAIARTPRAGMDRTDAFAADTLAADDIARLGALPETARIGGDVFLCHGTPISDSTYWLEEAGPDGIVRPRPRSDIAREADGIDASLMLCGHSHVPRLVRLEDGRLILNPGSVGRPGFGAAGSPHRIETGHPFASYAWAERSGGAWSLTFRCVPYDNGAAADRAAANGMDDWAVALRTGWLPR